MSVNVAGFDAQKIGQGQKNKVSVAPLAIVAGLLFLVPGALESYLVFSMVGVALGFAGVGAILVVYGVSLWVAEALERKNVVQGSAAFGLGIFLVIEFFAFMAFFAGLWMMHLFSDVWPPAGTPEMPWGMSMVMMVIMFLSAVAIFAAGNRYKNGNIAGFRSAVTMAVVFGALFLGLRGSEYLHLLSIGFTPATNAYSTCYYGITAFHAISVLAGTGAFVAMLIPAMSGKIDKTFVSAASMFWYFNTIACVFVVTQVYFWD